MELKRNDDDRKIACGVYGKQIGMQWLWREERERKARMEVGRGGLSYTILMPNKRLQEGMTMGSETKGVYRLIAPLTPQGLNGDHPQVLKPSHLSLDGGK